MGEGENPAASLRAGGGAVAVPAPHEARWCPAPRASSVLNHEGLLVWFLSFFFPHGFCPESPSLVFLRVVSVAS